MENAIAKLTRENHFNNLINNLPLFTILYATQCALAHYVFYDIVNPGSFAVALGTCLIFLVSSIYVYDKYHHVIIYKNRFHVYFEIFGISKTIMFDDIEDIVGPSEECEFSSLRLVLKNDLVYDLHFIDYPMQVRKILLTHLQNHKMDQEKMNHNINDLAA